MLVVSFILLVSISHRGYLIQDVYISKDAISDQI